jgi:hypothetical protein
MPGDGSGGGNADQTSMPGRPGGRTQQPMPPSTGSSLPPDVADARDDDIVARQLREAAMQETDPELQEKLWEEYRRYKGQ